MRPTELVAGLRAESGVGRDIARGNGIAIEERTGIDARRARRYGGLAAFARRGPGEVVGSKNRVRVVTQAVSFRVSVGNGVGHPGAPEPLAGILPSVENALQDGVGETELRIGDPISVKEVADVIIRVAVVVGAQAGRIELSQQRAAAHEAVWRQAAIGGFVEVV